jgi:hypothetical protein
LDRYLGGQFAFDQIVDPTPKCCRIGGFRLVDLAFPAIDQDRSKVIAHYRAFGAHSQMFSYAR